MSLYTSGSKVDIQIWPGVDWKMLSCNFTACTDLHWQSNIVEQESNSSTRSSAAKAPMFSNPAKKTDEGLQACWLQKTTIKHELKKEGQLLDLLDIQEHIVSFSLMLAWLTGIEVLLL